MYGKNFFFHFRRGHFRFGSLWLGRFGFGEFRLDRLFGGQFLFDLFYFDGFDFPLLGAPFFGRKDLPPELHLRRSRIPVKKEIATHTCSDKEEKPQDHRITDSPGKPPPAECGLAGLEIIVIFYRLFDDFGIDDRPGVAVPD